MSHLYEWFQQYPLASIELRRLSEACDADAEQLNWNLAYLEKKGWIELDLSIDCPPFISCTAQISAEGIDLIEDTAAFEAQFIHKAKDVS
jgi:hypothetical protein